MSLRVFALFMFGGMMAGWAGDILYRAGLRRGRFEERQKIFACMKEDLIAARESIEMGRTTVKDMCFSCEKVTTGRKRPDYPKDGPVCDNCGTPFGKLRCYEHSTVMEAAGKTSYGAWTFACDAGHMTEMVR